MTCRLRTAVLLTMLTLCVGACSSPESSLRRQPPDAPAAAARPAAALRGSLVSWDDLRATLAEAAGAVALEEVVLDRQLAERVAARSVAVPPPLIDAERDALTRAMEGGANLSANDAATQLERLRRTRGLGPSRFDALLLRNARLRALVRAESAAEVTPTPEQVLQEERIVNGERYRIRVFFHPSQAVCSQVREAVLSDEGPATAQIVASRFADAAVRQSSDPSARAGGLIDAASPADPAVPEAIRQSLATLEPGQVSPVLVSGRGFGLVLMEARLPAQQTLPREAVEQRVRARLERLAMEKLARELLSTSGLTVLDPSLAWAWETK